jgi:hypothetical protein
MFFNAALLVVIGILCLILTVVALIFGVVSLADKKSTKFIWITIFLCSLFGLIVCVVLLVKKVANTLGNFTENKIGQFENYNDSLSHFENIDKHQSNLSSSQITLLKSYLSENVRGNEPEEFYTYLGFKDYYRYPLRYPYSIHCMYSKDNGELFNEANVGRFDENDNGELFAGLGSINKIAFDKSYLLVEQAIVSTRTDKIINHYVLYNLDTEQKEETISLSRLLQLAKERGYTGPDTLMTLEQYHSLF